MKEINKTYEPTQVEEKLYKKWEEKGYFHQEPDKNKKPYTIVIPPPNITGQLHMGHALNNTLQDVLIRWRRMQGYCTLWLPGTDHASIATEAKIVDAMAKEGVTKEMIGRDEFLKKAWAWKDTYGGRIVQQLKRLGSSCDWQRERFTMDSGLSDAVLTVFVELYKKGLIYRGERITNWCPNCATSISDIEVEYEEREDKLWYIKYPLTCGGGFITVATTRPETMLGDTAVAVNPEDERYKDFIGKTVMLPLINKEIPVIADSYVESGFGTGAVKITPAHDPNDYEIGLRHKLPLIRVIDNKGIMNENAGDFSGLDRYEARKRILVKLEEQGLLDKTEPLKHNVGTCQRCSAVIEPSVSTQWFVKMKPLAEPAIKAVREGKIKFVPERFDKVYFSWMEDIKDWCISRQLWWGHRIPAWYCECGEITVSKERVDKCPKCGKGDLVQDSDTLDTWFSSALWPFSTLGWPEETEDLKYFFPTDCLVTGYDIIFFWVARMIFSSIENMGDIPFKYIFINGLVRDEKGRKMSKSLGNGIDPIDIMDKYGTDALRFSLISGNSPGNDQRFMPEKVEASRNFANKIWNAFRFSMMNIEEGADFSAIDIKQAADADKWILSRLNSLCGEVTDNLEKFELGMALQKIYEFIWDEFCDWYIELAKPRLFDKESCDRIYAMYVLNEVLCISMKLLHPFMPFVSGEIYSYLYHGDEDIMISKWPKYEKERDFFESEKKMNFVMDAVRAVRNIRTEMNVPPSKKASIIFLAENDFIKEIINGSTKHFEKLAYAQNVTVASNKSQISENTASAIISGAVVYLPLDELIDIEKETKRLNKEKENLEKEINMVNSKLNNEGFIKKAPEKVINEEKEKLEKYTEMLEKVRQRLYDLIKMNE